LNAHSLAPIKQNLVKCYLGIALVVGTCLQK
jgi:hypothetical protein